MQKRFSHNKIFEETLSVSHTDSDLLRITFHYLAKIMVANSHRHKRAFFAGLMRQQIRHLRVQKHQARLFRLLKHTLLIWAQRHRENVYVSLKLRFYQWKAHNWAHQRLHRQIRTAKAPKSRARFNPNYFTDRFSNHDESNLQIIHSRLQTRPRSKSPSIRDSFDSGNASLELLSDRPAPKSRRRRQRGRVLERVLRAAARKQGTAHRLLFVICFYKLISKSGENRRWRLKRAALMWLARSRALAVKWAFDRLRVLNAVKGRRVLFDELRLVNLKLQEFLFYDVNFRGKVSIFQDQISKQLDLD